MTLRRHLVLVLTTLGSVSVAGAWAIGCSSSSAGAPSGACTAATCVDSGESCQPIRKMIFVTSAFGSGDI